MYRFWKYFHKALIGYPMWLLHVFIIILFKFLALFFSIRDIGAFTPRVYYRHEFCRHNFLKHLQSLCTKQALQPDPDKYIPVIILSFYALVLCLWHHYICAHTCIADSCPALLSDPPLTAAILIYFKFNTLCRHMNTAVTGRFFSLTINTLRKDERKGKKYIRRQGIFEWKCGQIENFNLCMISYAVASPLSIESRACVLTIDWTDEHTLKDLFRLFARSRAISRCRLWQVKHWKVSLVSQTYNVALSHHCDSVCLSLTALFVIITTRVIYGW